VDSTVVERPGGLVRNPGCF